MPQIASPLRRGSVSPATLLRFTDTDFSQVPPEHHDSLNNLIRMSRRFFAGDARIPEETLIHAQGTFTALVEASVRARDRHGLPRAPRSDTEWLSLMHGEMRGIRVALEGILDVIRFNVGCESHAS